MRHLYSKPVNPEHRLFYEVNSRFVERGDLVERISDSFERHSSRPVLLYGPSGSGTTQVALRYAQEYAEHYRVMWLIDCADRLSARVDLATLAKELSLAMYSYLRPKPDLGHGTREALRWLDYNDDWLLIFDGAQDPHVALDLLPSEGHGHILITTANVQWPVQYTRRCSLTRIGFKPEMLPGAEISSFNKDEGVDYTLKLYSRQDEEESSAAIRFLLALKSYPLALGIVGALREWNLCSQLWMRACTQLRVPENATALVINSDEEALGVALRLAESEYQRYEGASELVRLYAVLGEGRVPNSLLVAMAPQLAQEERPKELYTLKRCGVIQYSHWGSRMHRAVAAHLIASLRRAEYRELVTQALAGMALALQGRGYGSAEAVPEDWIPHVLALVRRADSLGLRPELGMDLLGRSGRSLITLGLPELALEVLEEELALRLRRSLAALPASDETSEASEPVAPADPQRTVLDVLRDLGYAAAGSEQPERAVGYLQRALRLTESSGEAPGWMRAFLQQQLGEAALQASQFELAAEALLGAIDLSERLLGAEPETPPETLVEPLSPALCAEGAARCLEYVAGRGAESAPLRDRARRLAIKESASAAGSPARMVRLGELQLEAGAPEPALATFAQALAALPGPEHYKLSRRIHLNQAKALDRLERVDEAATALRRALYNDRIEIALPPDHETAELHRTLARLEEKRNGLEESAEHYRRALEICSELCEPTDPQLGVLHLLLGRVSAGRGEREAAAARCRRGWPLIERAFDRFSPAEQQEYAALREELLRVEAPLPAALPLPVPLAGEPTERERI